MTDAPREALVLITADHYPAAIEKLRQSATVTQQLPPTLALVVLPSTQREPTPNIPGVTFYTNEIPSDVVNNLSTQEQLFIRAWQLRRAAKERPGDQLPWDAPGHTPPD